MTTPRDDLMALAPCPFCGGEAERIDIPTVGSDPELGGDPNAGEELAWAQRHVGILRHKAEIARDGIAAAIRQLPTESKP